MLGLLSRPTVTEVMAYRAAIDERMASLLAGGSAGWMPRRAWSDPRGWFSVQYLETV